MRNKRLIIIFSILCCVTLIIVINSVFFTVQEIVPYCLNSDEDTYDSMILEAEGVRKGSSIFFLNEDSAVETMQQDLVSSGIVNLSIDKIERVFPNKVMIHYTIINPYYYVVSGNYTYFFAQSGVLLEIGEKDCDKQSSLQIVIGGDLESKTVGSSFASSESDDSEQVIALVEAVSKYITQADFDTTFNFVDIESDEYYIKMQQGAFIYIDTQTDFTELLQFGLSVYKERQTSSNADDVAQTQSGTFSPYMTDNGVVVSYSQEVYYDTRYDN